MAEQVSQLVEDALAAHELPDLRLVTNETIIAEDIVRATAHRARRISEIRWNYAGSRLVAGLALAGVEASIGDWKVQASTSVLAALAIRKTLRTWQRQEVSKVEQSYLQV